MGAGANLEAEPGAVDHRWQDARDKAPERSVERRGSDGCQLRTARRKTELQGCAGECPVDQLLDVGQIRRTIALGDQTAETFAYGYGAIPVSRGDARASLHQAALKQPGLKLAWGRKEISTTVAGQAIVGVDEGLDQAKPAGGSRSSAGLRSERGGGIPGRVGTELISTCE